MEKIVEQGLLFDFYGELLTDHQKRVYRDAVFEDMSLGEIAQEYGISRQGVHDLIRRCNNSLQEYEDKLHLVSRFMKIRTKIKEIDSLAEDAELSRRELAEGIRRISGHRFYELLNHLEVHIRFQKGHLHLFEGCLYILFGQPAFAPQILEYILKLFC